jgi:iron complex outermembrane receptor protein
MEVFTGIGRGVRTPDPEELYISLPSAPPAVTWIGNPDLDPTINHEVDLGVKFASDGYFVSSSVFYSRLTDYINLFSASPTVKSYRNIEAAMWGAELSGQVSLPFDLYLKTAVSYTEGRNRDDDRPLSEIPPLKGLVSLRYDNGRCFMEVTQTMVDNQDRVDTGLNEESTAGWATTDLKTGFDYRKWRIIAGVSNLFDKYYFSHLSYLRDPFASGVGAKVPENGRNYYLTVAIEM